MEEEFIENDTTIQVEIEDDSTPSLIINSEYEEDNNEVLDKSSSGNQQVEIQENQPVDNYELTGKLQPTYK